MHRSDPIRSTALVCHDPIRSDPIRSSPIRSRLIHSLQTSFAAGFKGNFSELCGNGSDKILTSEESCPIKSIFEFESKEEAFATFEKVQVIRQDLRKEASEKAKEPVILKNEQPQNKAL